MDTRTDKKPAAVRDNDGYDHREIAPQGQRAGTRGNPPRPPRTCFVSFREADFAVPPCCR